MAVEIMLPLNEKVSFSEQVNEVLEECTEYHVLCAVGDNQINHQTSNVSQIGIADSQETEVGSAISRVSGLQFNVADIPPWYTTSLYAIQQALATIPNIVAVCYIIHQNICPQGNQLLMAELVSASIFMSGVSTIIQCTFGVRIPVVQASSLVFVPSIVTMARTPEWTCPDVTSQTNGTAINGTNYTLESEEIWRSRLQEISGGLAVASLTQVIIGCTGILGYMMAYIGPLTIIPTIMLIGVILIQPIVHLSESQWGISVFAIAVMVISSLLLPRVTLPVPGYKRHVGCYVTKFPFFKLFPHLLGIVLAWLLCGVLTLTDVLPPSHPARTDTKLDVFWQAKWFFIPYPGQYGMLTFGPGLFLGMMAATLCTIIESVGDYYTTARIAGVGMPPQHAVNRGIATEGLASIVGATLGLGHGTTSYSTTVGFIGLTGMASRFVWQAMGVLLTLAGLFGKLGAVLAMLPDPILGGVLAVNTAMIMTVALSNLDQLDMKSTRNLTILGLSLTFGLALPQWLQTYPGAINTGHRLLDQTLTVVLSTHMLIGGVLGFTLDNLIPGTRKERGMLGFTNDDDDPPKTLPSNGPNSVTDRSHLGDPQSSARPVPRAVPDPVYGWPWVGDCLSRVRWTRHVPILPSYIPAKPRCCRRSPSTGPKTTRTESSAL